MICENPLTGNALLLNIAAFYSHKCAAQDGHTCKTQFQEQLKRKFSRLSMIPLTIQFSDNRFETIGIKICSLAEMTGKPESTYLTVPKYY